MRRVHCTLMLATALTVAACGEANDPAAPTEPDGAAPPPAAALAEAADAAQADAGPDPADPPGPATAQVIRDLSRPEHTDRFRAACEALADHWNDHTEAAALALIERPRYPRPIIWRFLDRTLLPETDPEQRRRLFDRFGANRGDRYRVAALVELTTRAMTYPTLDEPRRALAQLRYPVGADRTLGERFDLGRGGSGYQPLLDSLPPVIEQYALAELIDALPDDPGERIEAALADLLRRTTRITYDLYDAASRQMAAGTDYLVIVIARHLVGGGEDDRLRDYAKSRLHAAEHHGYELRQLLQKLNGTDAPEPN